MSRLEKALLADNGQVDLGLRFVEVSERINLRG